MSEVIYFGVEDKDNKGHYFYKPGFRHHAYDPPELRDENDKHLDGGWLTAQGVADVPGRAAYKQLNGYSVVTWWDRTGDSRGACNSAFIVRGDHSPQEVMRLGGEAFPTIVARQKRPVTLPDGTVILGDEPIKVSLEFEKEVYNMLQEISRATGQTVQQVIREGVLGLSPNPRK